MKFTEVEPNELGPDEIDSPAMPAYGVILPADFDYVDFRHNPVSVHHFDTVHVESDGTTGIAISHTDTEDEYDTQTVHLSFRQLQAAMPVLELMVKAYQEYLSREPQLRLRSNPK